MGGFDRRLIGVFAVLLVMAFWAGGKYEEIRSLRQAEEVIISTNMDEKPGHDNEQQQEPEMVYIKVYVTGEVNRPGVFEVPEGTRVYEAVELAGGVTEKSDVLHVDMARKYAHRVIGIREGRILFDKPIDNIEKIDIDLIYGGSQDTCEH
jgi:hypothetical protein